ncbi:MAG: HD domain-containing protein [Betaproteobacteria bacterium]|nr:HD domain-containing protein [Betaproteobacteria bacterium]
MSDPTQPYPLGLSMLPQIFRLTSLHVRRDDHGEATLTAHLFHERAQLKVRWTARKVDPRLCAGLLVGPRWTGPASSLDGCLRIARLAIMDRPVAALSLFDTVPPGWVRERSLVQRAHALLAELPASYHRLFHAVLWEDDRFRGFCIGPSSMHGHHNGTSGNLRHTVEVAEQVRALCAERLYVHRDLAVLSALLHDCGKAVEYRLKPDGSWGLSDRGRLLGHRVTAIEWIAAALARWPIRLPDGHAQVLLHNLSAVAHAPRWMGLREPQTAEAEMLSLADRLSGTDDLMQRCLPDAVGWGRYHRHLGRQPFRVATTQPAAGVA